MDKRVRGPVLALALLLAAVSAAGAVKAAPRRYAVEEERICKRLGAINAEAVPLFQKATESADAGDLNAAKSGFEQTLALAPEFPDALRRLSYVERELGNIPESVSLARRALAADPSAFNHSALAHALCAVKTPQAGAEALAHARTAVELLPEDEWVNLTLIEAAITNQDIAAIGGAAGTLMRVAPENASGFFFGGLVAAERDEWEESERLLLRAQALGIAPADIQSFLDKGIRRQASLARWRRRGLYALGAWVACLPLLFAVGILLSRLTLAAARRPQIGAASAASLSERSIRTAYRLVIGLTSIYFYVSIPLLLLIVVGVAAGIFYLFFLAGRIPIKLALIIGIAAVYTVYAVGRSLFIRIKESDPGRLLTRAEAPQLWAVAEEVAGRAGTRSVDAIFITPRPEMAVTEQGGILRKSRGRGRRCLILGLGVLPGMTQRQFKAILAHEYGHFSHRDTAGGDVALQVRASMYQMAYGLARAGQARWSNPAWLFINGFHRIFMRVTLGASRLQEILADRCAAAAYGTRSFVAALTHVVRQDALISAQLEQEVNSAAQEKRSLRNLYALPPAPPDSAKKAEEQLARLMSAPTSPYDSHPAVKDRIELLEKLNLPDPPEEAEAPAWSLLPDADGLQKEMTALVQANLRNREEPQTS